MFFVLRFNTYDKRCVDNSRRNYYNALFEIYVLHSAYEGFEGSQMISGRSDIEMVLTF